VIVTLNPHFYPSILTFTLSINVPLQARPGRAQSDRRDSAALTGKTIDGAVFGE